MPPYLKRNGSVGGGQAEGRVLFVKIDDSSSGNSVFNLGFPNFAVGLRDEERVGEGGAQRFELDVERVWSFVVHKRINSRKRRHLAERDREWRF